MNAAAAQSAHSLNSRESSSVSAFSESPPRRVQADARAGRAGRARGARVGDDGDRRHVHGRAVGSGGNRRCRHRQFRLHGRVRLRHGDAARPRHARGAKLRRRSARRLPSLAGARHRAQPGADHSRDWPSCSLWSPLWISGVWIRASCRSRDYLQVVSWSLLPLLLYAAFRRYLQATGSVAPDHGCARPGQRRQRCLQLGVHLREARDCPRSAYAGRRGRLSSPACSWPPGCCWRIVYRDMGPNPGLFDTTLRIDPA